MVLLRIKKKTFVEVGDSGPRATQNEKHALYDARDSKLGIDDIDRLR